MEAMLNEMYKLGCKKEYLKAKIAGGANILHDLSDNIGMKNVMFARNFCKAEQIPIVAENVLGNHGRVIMLDSDFQTITKKIANSAIDKRIAQADKTLSTTVDRYEPVVSESSITLF